MSQTNFNQSLKMGFPIPWEENKIYLTKRKLPPKSDSSPVLCKEQKTPSQKRKSPLEPNNFTSTKNRKTSRPSTLSGRPSPTFLELPPHGPVPFNQTSSNTADLEPVIAGKLQQEIAPGDQVPTHIAYQCFHTATPQEYFESPMFTVFVGRERIAFLLPLKLACHKSGKFYRSYASSRLQAGSSICFDTVNVEVFRQWFAWVYRNHGLDGHDLKSLYKLYYLAADLESGDLINAALDSIRDHYLKENTWPKQERVEHIYKNTATTSQLRSFVVSCVYYRLMVLRDKVHTYFGDVTINIEFVRDYVQYTQDLSLETENTDPRKREGCRFHDHKFEAGHMPLKWS
ncbi:hypothetical protein MMC18_000809 [Xylographa bjoerkii]|nr:hypothetical protein [Xylographa bjoerkii]